jgi:peptidoglycan/xylan/chitin deacetylase (PgdA/CDA1 family)
MKLASFLMQSRGPINLAKRIPTIVTRFGINERKIDGCLNRFIDSAGEFGVRPTLAVTANLLERYPELFSRLADKGVEFAVHGLVHTDYSQLSLESHMEHINKAIDIFNRRKISFSGFRCPYLRSNEHTLKAVKRLGFTWESSDVIAWDVVGKRVLKGNSGLAYKKLLGLYSAKSSISHFSVPKICNGLVEIPVSIPDDEAIADRLGLSNSDTIGKLWMAILKKSYERGDIFTIQLHHERVPLFEQALRNVLHEAKMLEPGVFIASLGEIADWCLRRNRFSLNLESAGTGHYRISLLDGTENTGPEFKIDNSDITVLVKNARIEDAPSDEWYGGYKIVHSRRFTVRCRKRPVVSVGSGLHESVIEFIKNEGFIVEPAGNKKIAALTDTNEMDEVSLVLNIENSGTPIVRIWRWPHGLRSAVAVTGDIDSITLVDFARRFFEVRNERAA